MFQNRSGQGGADGVMYRRAKLWQIIMVSTYQRIYWNGVLFSHRPCKLYGKYRLWYCDSGSRRDFDLYSYF